MCICTELSGTAMLEAGEGEEHGFVIKTKRPEDSFILLGSSEPVISRSVCCSVDEKLVAVTLGAPAYDEDALAIIVVYHALSGAQCVSCGGAYVVTPPMFVQWTPYKTGSFRVFFDPKIEVPLRNSLVSSPAGVLRLQVPDGRVFVTKETEISKSRGIFFLPAQKLLQYILRPSPDFLEEACRSSRLDRIVREQEKELCALREVVIAEHKNAEEVKRLQKMLAVEMCERARAHDARVHAEEELAGCVEELSALCQEYNEIFDNYFSEITAEKETRKFLEEQLDDALLKNHDLRRKVKYAVTELQKIKEKTHKKVDIKDKEQLRDELDALIKDLIGE